MSIKKTIAVVGATGTQGRSVALSFLSHAKDWNVRCITRNTTSPTAVSLANQGAEVVRADLDDPASLREAFKGAHVIFVNTDFWGTYLNLLPTGYEVARDTAKETEIRQARNAVQVAAEQTHSLERFVYSALGPMSRASNGKYHSAHWETKAATVDYIEEQFPDLAAKTSYIYIGIYANNAYLMPKPSPSGTGPYEILVNCSADTKMPIIDTASSAGPFVYSLVQESPRTKLLAYDSLLTVTEAAETWERVTGKEAKIESLSTEEMQQRTPLSIEVLGGPVVIGEYGYMAGIEGWIGPDDLRNKPQTDNYEAFLRKQSQEFLLEGKFFNI